MGNWWDTNDAESTSDALPIDNYEFEITRAKVMQSKTGKLMADCEFTVCGSGDNLAGRKVWEYLMLEGKAIFKVAALASAVTNPRKVPTEDGKFEDEIDGGEIVLMNYGDSVERIKPLMQSVPVDSDGFPVNTPDAKDIWGDVCGLLVGKKIQAAVEWETDSYGTKARIGRFAPVNEKTLAKWRSSTGATGATPRSAQTDTPDMPDDGLPF